MKNTALTLLICAMAATAAFAPDQDARAEEARAEDARRIEIHYVPRTDLRRMGGYDGEGLFMPLSELVGLARAAAAAGAESRPAPGGLYVRELRMQGVLGDSAGLSGVLAYSAPSADWSAVAIDDGSMLWTGQEPAPDGQAFLARVGGRTWLFARGPGEGTLRLRCVLALATAIRAEAGEDVGRQEGIALTLGRLFVPARFDVQLPAGFRLRHADTPTSATGQALTLWPLQATPARAVLDRVSDLDLSPGLQAELERTVSMESGAALVADRLVVRDRFSQGQTLEIPLPEGLTLLDIGGEEGTTVQMTDGRLRVTATAESGQLAWTARFAAPMNEGRAVLSAWDLPALSWTTRLTTRYSDTHILSVVDPPDGLTPLAGDGAERRFVFHGPLPPLALRLTRREIAFTPDVRASAHIRPNQALVTYSLDLSDRDIHEVRFVVPAGWLLVDGAVLVDGVPSPFAMEERSDGDWRIAWAPGAPAGRAVSLTLRQSGLLFRDDAPTSLALPFLGWPDFLPASYQMAIQWDPSLNARLTHTQGVQTVAPSMQGGPAQTPSNGWNTLTLSASGAAPEAVLSLQALPPDLSATVTTALNVLDDTIETRVCLDFFVQLAPTSVFRFVLPSGTGSGVRIAGEDIREQSMATTDEGELWTLITQREALNDVRFTLEWATPFQPGAAPAQAPRIVLPDVTSLTGYLVVEGAHALRLDLGEEDLTETDQWELPPLPWTRHNRILAVYRHGTAPWALTIGAERMPVQSAGLSVAREARLVATVAADGGRLVRAEYAIAPGGSDPFFAVTLPEGARLWSILVNGVGVMPIRRSEADNDDTRVPILAPLPARRIGGADTHVTVIYRQNGAPLGLSSHFEAQAPDVTIPINRTIWTLRLPREFEVLAMGRDGRDRMTLAETTARFFRTAHYPSLILFADWALGRAILAIGFLIFAPAIIYLAALLYRRQSQTYAPATSAPSLDATGAAQPRRRSPLRILSAIALIILTTPVLIFMLFWSPSLTFFALVALFFVLWHMVGRRSRRRDELPQAPTPSDASGAAGAATGGPLLRRDDLPRESGCLAGAGKLIGIGLVILILAIIAMPNFLEAQIRAKSSRAMADLRSLATGLESYRIDHNIYPQELSALTSGKVKHVNEIFPDFFNPVYGTPYRYLIGAEAAAAARMAGLVDADLELPDDFWMLYSVGPDGVDQGGRIAYDWAQPDRGGDLIYIRRLPSMGSSYVSSLSGESWTRRAGVDRAAADGDESDGRARGAERLQEMADEEMAAPIEAPPPPVAEPEAPGAQRRPSPQQPLSQMAQTDRPVDAGALATVFEEEDRKRELAEGVLAEYQGLLSMGIALPEVGVKREFTYLGHADTLRFRLLNRNAFLRMNHVIRLAVFVALFGVWWFQRRRYWTAFCAVVTVALLAPVVLPTVWTVCANTALEGALLSLVAPALAWMIQRFRREVRALAGLAPLVALCLLAQPARATDTPTARIIAPYDTVLQARRGEDLPAYLSREDFARLWQAAHHPAAAAPALAPALMDYQMDAWLDLEAQQLKGSVALSVCNLSSATATLELGLWDMGWSDWSNTWSSADARVVATTGGLSLVLPPQWRGVVSGQFTQSCVIAVNTVRLSLRFPQTASGAWRIRTPHAEVELLGPCDGTVLITSAPEGAVLSGPVRGEGLDLAWRVFRGDGVATGDGMIAAALPMGQARLEARIQWNHTGPAQWSARLTPPPLDAGSQSAPRTLVFYIDPELRLTGIDGRGLRQAVVRDPDGAESELVRQQKMRPGGRVLTLELERRATEAIALQGLVLQWAPPQPIEEKGVAWTIPSLRDLHGGALPTDLRLQVHRDLEITNTEAEGMSIQPMEMESPALHSQLRYQSTQAGWTMVLTLARGRVWRDGVIEEVVVPGESFDWRLADIQIRLPQGGLMENATILLPPDYQVLTCQGDQVAAWAKIDDRLEIYLTPADPAVPIHISLTGRVFHGPSGAGASLPPEIQPLDLLLAGEGGPFQRGLAIFIPPDQEMQETDIGTAQSVPSRDISMALASRILTDHDRVSGRLVDYALTSAQPLRFAWSAIDSAARYEIINQAIVSEGIETLEAQVRVTARRGRLRRVEVDLWTPNPADQIASRIQALGLPGQTHVDPLPDGRYRFSADLPYSVAETVSFRLRIEWPLDQSDPEQIGLAAFAPVADGGSRTLMLVRTAFDGALTPAPGTGLRAIEWATEPALREAFINLSADQAFELTSDPPSPPRFLVERYERAESLQAVVESIRQRIVLSEDGVERNVLDIIVQNRSEQFLTLSLPYRFDRLQVYQVLVAGQEAPVGVSEDDSQTRLVIPLIRPGLLDPEVAIRVAYVVDTGAPLTGSRSRRQIMPRVLGGLPVVESSMILVLPTTLKYSRFGGSMRQVDLLDLEAADALRLAEKTRKLSEIALNTTGLRQQNALTHLRYYNTFAESQINEAMISNRAQTRVYGYNAPDSKENLSLMRRANEREDLLSKAQAVVGDNYDNVRRLEEMVAQQQALAPEQQARWTQQMAMPQQLAPWSQQLAVPQDGPGSPIQAEPAVEPLVFSADGEVLAFRQLQGAGDVRFAHASLEAGQRRWDLVFAVVLTLALWGVVFRWEWLFGSVRRAAAIVAAVALACLVLLVAVDLMLPVLVVAILVWWKRRHNGAHADPLSEPL